MDDKKPIRLVRQSALPVKEEIVLTPVEVAALLAELRDPFSTLILLAPVTGLRRGGCKRRYHFGCAENSLTSRLFSIDEF
jgi:hypothetical protein